MKERIARSLLVLPFILVSAHDVAAQGQPAAAPPPVPPPAVAKPKPDDGTVTLRDAVAQGIRTNPQIDVVGSNLRASQEVLGQAHSLYLPSVDASADSGYANNSTPSTRAAGTNNDFLWRSTAGVTLTQLLFDGWGTYYENLSQKARVLSATHRVREASELTALAIVESYLDVLRQRELVQLTEDNVKRHEDFLTQINGSTSNGITTDADVKQVVARLENARAARVSAMEALRVAEANYIRDTAQPVRRFIIPAKPAGVLAADVDKEIRISLAQSPTLAIFRADQEAAWQESEKSQSAFYPTVNLQLNGGAGNNLGGERGNTNDSSALVVAKWNLYRGGGDDARRNEAAHRQSQARAESIKGARALENDIRQTWARMVSAGERYVQYNSQADANETLVGAYKQQFDLARRTLLDVLDAQNETLASRSGAVNARYVELLAIYRLLALRGELLKQLDVNPPVKT